MKAAYNRQFVSDIGWYRVTIRELFPPSCDVQSVQSKACQWTMTTVGDKTYSLQCIDYMIFQGLEYPLCCMQEWELTKDRYHIFKCESRLPFLLVQYIPGLPQSLSYLIASYHEISIFPFCNDDTWNFTTIIGSKTLNQHIGDALIEKFSSLVSFCEFDPHTGDVYPCVISTVSWTIESKLNNALASRHSVEWTSTLTKPPVPNLHNPRYVNWADNVFHMSIALHFKGRECNGKREKYKIPIRTCKMFATSSYYASLKLHGDIENFNAIKMGNETEMLTIGCLWQLNLGEWQSFQKT